jgi:hypothetical protein
MGASTVKCLGAVSKPYRLEVDDTRARGWTTSGRRLSTEGLGLRTNGITMWGPQSKASMISAGLVISPFRIV